MSLWTFVIIPNYFNCWWCNITRLYNHSSKSMRLNKTLAKRRRNKTVTYICANTSPLNETMTLATQPCWHKQWNVNSTQLSKT